MKSTDPKKPAFPRGVIRLLRSGSLDEARTRRVLETHDLTEVEWLLRSANDPQQSQV
jgi:hypothetical protein